MEYQCNVTDLPAIVREQQLLHAGDRVILSGTVYTSRDAAHKRLTAAMKEQGKTTVLEVVAYTEEEGLAGAETAAACGCDILMGTTYSKRILDYCRARHIRYMPFVTTIESITKE